MSEASTGVEHAVQEGNHGTAGRSEVDGRTEDETVGFVSFVQNFIDDVVAEAAAGVGTSAAANASGNHFVAYSDDFAFDPLTLQFVSDLFQCGIGTALGMGASILRKVN